MTDTLPTDPRSAIENLIHAYAERLDLGDFAGVGSLFADADYGPAGATPLRGSAAVTDVMHASVRLHGETPGTKHVTSNRLSEVDGDRATARSYFTVFQRVGTPTPQVIVQGRYYDAFVHRNGRWSFASRVIHMDVLGDVSRHLKLDLSRFTGD
jgi:hypothetical protein